MKYKVMGAHITNVYEVENNKDSNGGYYKKPEFVSNKKESWEQILNFESDQLIFNDYREYGRSSCRINISETEEVTIIKTIFRADEATIYLYSDKVLSETEDVKTNQEQYYREVNDYIQYIFKEYPKVKEHCEIYNVTNLFENIDAIKNEVLGKRIDGVDAFCALSGTYPIFYKQI